MRSLFCLATALLLTTPLIADPPKWRKTTITTAFHSEGVAFGDLNKDGKVDIVTGEFWYEAPEWKPHELRKPGNYGNGEKGYSQSFAVWTDDLNGDGWLDVIVIGFPGAPCYWYENPKGGSGHWQAHEIWHSACNETPIYADLFNTGKRVLVMGWQPRGKSNEGQMAWFAPGVDPTKLWEMHPISLPSTPEQVIDGKKIPRKEIPGTQRFSHGLGVADVDGDGLKDVLVPQGWWKNPGAKTNEAWAWNPAAFGEACADMHTVDLDGDGKLDVISSSAHNYGIWSFRQRTNKAGAIFFEKVDLFPKLVSQTHALQFRDINGDGLKDLVTGKRWWAHGPKGDADPMADPCLYWFEAKKSSDGVISFTPHLIDNASGIGTQFEVGDANGDGKPDIVVANKRGVFFFVQE